MKVKFYCWSLAPPTSSPRIVQHSCFYCEQANCTSNKYVWFYCTLNTYFKSIILFAMICLLHKHFCFYRISVSFYLHQQQHSEFVCGCSKKTMSCVFSRGLATFLRAVLTQGVRPKNQYKTQKSLTGPRPWRTRSISPVARIVPLQTPPEFYKWLHLLGCLARGRSN